MPICPVTMGPQEDFGRNGSGEEPREPLGGISRLRRLPPGPYRSLGKYLNYEGWPECQRFLELDDAIRAEVQDGRSHDNRDDWEETLTADERKQRADTIGDGCRSRSTFRSRPDHLESESSRLPSFAEIARALEQPRLRRL